MRALIIVDVQPTFCEEGELPVTGGNDIADRIADYLHLHHERYGLVVTTQDWHSDPGTHFSPTPDYVDTWPPHGQAGTPTAELHPHLITAMEELHTVSPSLPHVAVKKGHHRAAYSGFEGETDEGASLTQILHHHNVQEVDVVGLALSHCVAATALDAHQSGFTTTVMVDLSRPVTEELGQAAVRDLTAAGVTVTHSPMWSITCFMAARSGRDPQLMEAAVEVGLALAGAGHCIVYGGGNVGLMGGMADAAMGAGGCVVGVIPTLFDGHGVDHRGLTRMEVVSSMAARKQRMTDLGECFVCLPGGVGTLEELFDVWAHFQLRIHTKPVVLYNVAGYWDALVGALDSAVEFGLMGKGLRGSLQVVESVPDLLAVVTRPVHQAEPSAELAPDLPRNGTR